MNPSETIKLPVDEIRQLAIAACLASGASAPAAGSLVAATLSAACCGNAALGFPHFIDYLRSFREGRIVGAARPSFSRPFPAFIQADANGGIAQLGFDLAFEDLVACAATYGMAIFSQKNGYTAGEIGYYPRRLAQRGLVSIAAANAHALMAAAPGGARVYSTNPLAFGVPLPAPRAPLVIDQASSATAFVNIAEAAAEGARLPEGWAVAADGTPTTDAGQALLGALLPFGGYKGANVALMVEILSAGLSGAAWSLDAGNFREGDRPPNAGLTIIAIAAAAAEAGFIEPVAAHLSRLEQSGVHIPGSRSKEGCAEAQTIDIKAGLLAEIRGFAK